MKNEDIRQYGIYTETNKEYTMTFYFYNSVLSNNKVFKSSLKFFIENTRRLYHLQKSIIIYIEKPPKIAQTEIKHFNTKKNKSLLFKEIDKIKKLNQWTYVAISSFVSE